MTRSYDSGRMEKGGLPFAAMLWMTIMLALICALAPLGPPSSRQAGSAFNPATTTVALKARSASQQVLHPMADPDGSGPAAPPVPAALMPVHPLHADAGGIGGPSFTRSLIVGTLAAFRPATRLARAPPSQV